MRSWVMGRGNWMFSSSVAIDRLEQTDQMGSDNLGRVSFRITMGVLL